MIVVVVEGVLVVMIVVVVERVLVVKIDEVELKVSLVVRLVRLVEDCKMLELSNLYKSIFFTEFTQLSPSAIYFIISIVFEFHITICPSSSPVTKRSPLIKSIE